MLGLVGVALHTSLSFAAAVGTAAAGGRSGSVMVGDGVRLPASLSGLRRDQVARWRMDYARRVIPDDELLAAPVASTDVDVHAVEALTKRGCPPALGVEIVR